MLHVGDRKWCWTLTLGVLVWSFGSASVALKANGTSPKSPIGRSDTFDDDEITCASKSITQNAFCLSDLPRSRAALMRELISARDSCEWRHRGRSQQQWHSVSGEYLDDGPHSKEDVYSRERHADWNGIELIGHNQIDTKLQICFVTQKSNWTFERLGTFHSRGGDLDVWYQFGWPDAGQFKAALSVGDVWVTAFSFAPSFLNGSYIGYPPLRIHHTHVTSSHHSSDLNQGWKGFRNTEGYVGIEFDVHGDRQCHPSRGGTDCLAFAYASGFGMRLSDPLEVFGDINDVRAFGSPQLDFQLQYAFRWTSQPQTRVTKLITEIGTVQVQAGWERWGSMALIFDPLYPTEYLAWCERFFPMDGSLAKVYYHSHHMFTEDYWTVVGSARMLEFDSSPYSNREDESKANNLTQYGLTIESVKHHVLSRIHEVQNECQTNGCEIVPRLLCSIAVDWEVVVDGQTEKPYPRYRPAQCQGAELRFKNGDPLVIMSFHRDVGGSVKDFPLTVFSHTTWYAIAIPSSNQTYRNETHKGFSAALSSPQVRKIPHAATLARDLSKLRLLNLSDPQYKSQLNLYQPY